MWNYGQENFQIPKFTKNNHVDASKEIRGIVKQISNKSEVVIWFVADFLEENDAISKLMSEELLRHG